MLPIQGAPPVTTPTPVARRPTAGRAAAFVPSDASVPVTETATSGVAEPALAAMLALQEGAGTPDSGVAALQDRRARRHGRDLLEALAALQRSMLGDSPTGAFQAGALQHLAALAADPTEAADPGLQHIMAEIRLRAGVELARYEAG